MNEKLQMHYDQAGDVLYVSLGEPSCGVSEEELGAVWRYDPTSGKLVGVTLVDFATFWRPRLPEIASLIAQRFHRSERETAYQLQQVA
jgi:hypothetical protein